MYLYPVITLSTNTDLGRYLDRDSFVILRFDLSNKQWKKEKGLIKQSIFNKKD